MRYGFTTGSCAAAAAKAAAYMLLSGRRKETMTIETPKGIPYKAKIENIQRRETCVTCGVCKDGGDDPDITTGTYIYAKVSLSAKEGTGEGMDRNPVISIDGGMGVGRITRPGLDQPTGNAAINSVPRKMIEKEVGEICELFDYTEGLQVIIFVPEGEILAKKTFNPRLGITGGISILGTTGIVEPMSSQALLDTILIELKQKREEGETIAAISPGNYGLEFMKRTYGYDLEKSVKCSNFIGCTIDMVKKLGFQRMLLTGHIGKLIKVSGGIMNTHSKEGDCRMELFAAAAIRAGADGVLLQQLLACVSTEDAALILKQNGLLALAMEQVMLKIADHVSHRAGGEVQIECMVYSNALGLLGETKGAQALLQELLKTKQNR